MNLLIAVASEELGEVSGGAKVIYLGPPIPVSDPPGVISLGPPGPPPWYPK
jgi:hypothetical protein